VLSGNRISLTLSNMKLVSSCFNLGAKLQFEALGLLIGKSKSVIAGGGNLRC
jgi:hypothetical protein